MADSSLPDGGYGVQPELLADAGRQMTGHAGDLRTFGYDLDDGTPPPEAFGQLPESHEFATALGRAVNDAKSDLDEVISRVTAIGEVLASGAKDYADRDRLAARWMREALDHKA